MKKVAAGIALTSTIVKPVAACNVVTVGRVQLGIDGLSQKCCDGVKPKLDNVVATKGKGKGKEEAMMAFVENCCDEGDQHVLATLAPEEPPDAPITSRWFARRVRARARASSWADRAGANRLAS